MPSGGIGLFKPTISAFLPSAVAAGGQILTTRAIVLLKFDENLGKEHKKLPPANQLLHFVQMSISQHIRILKHKCIYYTRPLWAHGSTCLTFIIYFAVPLGTFSGLCPFVPGLLHKTYTSDCILLRG